MLVTGYPLVSYDVPWSVLPQTAAPAPVRKRKQTTKQKKQLKIQFHSVFYDVSRRIITNLSFDGDTETIDGSLGAVSLTKDVSIVKLMQTSVRSHTVVLLATLIHSTLSPSNWNKAGVMLFTADDDQQLLFWQIINLVDAFALNEPSDFYSEKQQQKKRNLKSNRLETHQMRKMLLFTFTIEVDTK